MDIFLNDDCWLTILQYLQLEDQLALGEVSPQLQQCVSRRWKCLTTAKIDGQVLNKFLLNSSLMFKFVSSACGTLKKLTIEGDIMGMLNAWRMFDFPNLQTLDCNWQPDRLDLLCPITENALTDQWLVAMRWQQADEISMLLTELFPQLRRLTLRSNARGSHLWRLYQLEELHIYKPPTSETNEFFARILIMSNLHKLYLHDPQCLIEFANQNPLKVKSMRFIHHRPPLRLDAMENLQGLAVHGCKLDTLLLHQISFEVPSLEELHLTAMDVREFPDLKEFWLMLSQCVNLKILNLSGSCFNTEEFVEFGTRWLSVAFKERLLPLRLYVGQQYESLKILTTMKHPKLEIKFESIELERKKTFYTKQMEIELTNC